MLRIGRWAYQFLMAFGENQEIEMILGVYCDFWSKNIANHFPSDNFFNDSFDLQTVLANRKHSKFTIITFSTFPFSADTRGSHEDNILAPYSCLHFQ